jgi:hypothetical protein
MVPVNLRPLEKAWKLGNRFGLAPLVLPIGIANPVERVYAVRRRMNELKGSYQPLLAFARAVGQRPVHQAGAGRHPGPVRQEGHRGDDQRARPDVPLQVLRQHAAAEHVLGAGLGRHRRGRVHPQLRRRRAVRPDHRRAAVPRAAGRSSTASNPSSTSCCGWPDAALGGEVAAYYRRAMQRRGPWRDCGLPAAGPGPDCGKNEVPAGGFLFKAGADDDEIRTVVLSPQDGGVQIQLVRVAFGRAAALR